MSLERFNISVYDNDGKTEPQNQKGYIYTITIPGWEKKNTIKVTIHKQDTYTKLTKWVLSEYSSGYKIRAGRTKKELIEKFIEQCLRVNEKAIMKRIRSKPTINE